MSFPDSTRLYQSPSPTGPLHWSKVSFCKTFLKAPMIDCTIPSRFWSKTKYHRPAVKDRCLWPSGPLPALSIISCFIWINQEGWQTGTSCIWATGAFGIAGLCWRASCYRTITYLLIYPCKHLHCSCKLNIERKIQMLAFVLKYPIDEDAT